MKRWVDSDGLRPEESQARDLLIEVELPAPNPQARARVWARMQAKRPRPTPLVRIGLVGAALGAILVWVAPGSPDPGLVVVAADGDQGLVGAPLAPARPLVVGAADRLELKGPVAGRLVLASGSEVELLAELGEHLRLKRGQLSRQGELEWALESPPYQLIARGDFWVARLGEVITVDVQRGEVELRGPKLHRVLHAGEHFETPARAEATAPGAGAPDASQLAQSPKEEVARQLADEPPALGRRPSSGPRANGRRSGAGEVRRSLAPAIEAPVSPRPEATEAAGAEPGSLRRPTETTVETPAIPSLSATAPEVAPAPVDWAALYRRAQETRTPARAIPIFDQVAASDSPYAEVAGHQAARLVMRQDAGAAIPRYQRLLLRFPNGAYVPEGRLNLIECRLITQDLDGASRELEAFLARYPSSERTAELLRMKDNLARRKKP
ncbi:MAG: outer membrane protein assembly factor BamD [Deltaproteobacteria bacterium]|nr:outer membrane protein assembly factor BamD [Deltaproteobacteria bacterium]